MATNRVETRLTARDETARAFRTLSSNLSKVNAAFLNVAKVAAGLGAVFTGVFIRDLVSVNKEFQSLKASLITFTGSVENADGAFNILKRFAKETPFSLQEVVGSFNILVAQGIRPTEKQLTAFADIAGGTSKSIMQFAEAVADASVGEFERLKEFGIKASKEGDKVTLKIGDMTKTVQNDSASIVAALSEISETKFAGGAARQAETLGGAITNLRDTVDEFLFSIGEQGFSGELVKAIGILKNAVSGNEELAQTISRRLVTALQAAVLSIRFVVDNLDTLLLAMGTVFGLGVLRKVITMGKGFIIFAKAVAKAQLAVTIFSAITKSLQLALKGGIAGFVAATAALGGLAVGVDTAIKQINENIDVNNLLAGTFKALGLETGYLENRFNELAGEAGNVDEAFVQNDSTLLDFIPTLGKAGDATDKLSGSSEKLSEAIDSVKERLRPVETALGDLAAEKAVLQRLFETGKISADKYKSTLNTMAREALGLDTTISELSKRQNVAKKAFAAGIITANEYENTLSDIKSETIDYNAENEKTFGAGAIKGVKDYYQSIKNNAANMSTFVGGAFSSLESTLSDFFMTGKLDFGTFTDAIKRGLADLAAKAVISTGINFLSNIFPNLAFADGGLVPGSGGPRSDDVLARVSSGEYVIRASTVSKFGKGFFDQLNGGQMPQGGGGGDGGGIAIDAGVMESITPGYFIGKIVDKVQDVLRVVDKGINKAVEGVVNTVKKIVGYITNSVRGLIEGIMSGDLTTLLTVASMFILPGVGGAIASGLGSGAGFVNAVTTGISQSLSAGILGSGSLTSIATSVGVNAARNVLTDGLSSALSQSITGVTDGMSGDKRSFARDQAGAFTTLYNKSAPYLAAMTGANVRGGDNVRVGERGPEMFIPGRDGTIAPIKSGGSELIGAVNDMKDEIISLRRQMSRMMASGGLAGARS